jgi:hypothetical protein
MLAEALEKLRTIITEAQQPQTVELARDDECVYIAHNGELKLHKIPQVPDRKHEVQTLEDLAKVVKNHGSVQVEDGEEKGEVDAFALSTVWHSDAEVVALLGDPMRKDRVTMKLITSPVFQRLAGLERDAPLGANKLDQRAFIRLLKFDFDKAGEFDQLIASARELKFRQSEEGAASLQQGRESLGRQVLAEVKGLEDFPEEFTVEYPVYVNPDLATVKAAVTCSLEIDVQSEKFIVTPKPDEMLAARQHVHQWIGERLEELLKEREVPVYYGKP